MDQSGTVLFYQVICPSSKNGRSVSTLAVVHYKYLYVLMVNHVAWFVNLSP